MPNWCDTTYKAVGTKEQVKKFYDLAMSSWNKTDNNQGWLGHFVTELGGNWEQVYCRGWMRDQPYLNNDGTECTIFCYTAWGEPNQWREFIQSQIDGLFLYYVAIEPGCGVYCSNDDYYADKYYVDYAIEQPDSPYMTEDELLEFMSNELGVDLDSADECIEYAKRYTENNDNEWLFINEMEITD